MVGSGYLRIGADLNALLSLLRAFTAELFHAVGLDLFLRRDIKECALELNPWVNSQKKRANLRKLCRSFSALGARYLVNVLVCSMVSFFWINNIAQKGTFVHVKCVPFNKQLVL